MMQTQGILHAIMWVAVKITHWMKPRTLCTCTLLVLAVYTSVTNAANHICYSVRFKAVEKWLASKEFHV